jgi:hypothetical protein
MARLVNGAFFGHVNETYSVSIGVGSGIGSRSWQDGDYLMITIMDGRGDPIFAKPCPIDAENARAIFSMNKEDASSLAPGAHYWMIEAVTSESVTPANGFKKIYCLDTGGKGDANGA